MTMRPLWQRVSFTTVGQASKGRFLSIAGVNILDENVEKFQRLVREYAVTKSEKSVVSITSYSFMKTDCVYEQAKIKNSVSILVP